MRTRRSLPQDAVGVFGNALYLHARHGAILALMAATLTIESRPSSFGLRTVTNTPAVEGTPRTVTTDAYSAR